VGASLLACQSYRMSRNRREIHFLTFGGGANWPGAARRLTNQAKATGLFASTSSETGNDFFLRWPEFALHRPFIDANARGWGYWIWKPFLVRSYMHRIKDGEVIFYLDAGCEILPQNRSGLSSLLGHLNSSDHLVWDYSDYPIFNLVFWTKQNLLDRAEREFGLTDPLRLPKVWAGGFGLVKTKRNVSLLEDWFRLSTSDNYHLVDDTPAPTPQRYPYFEHRHDQSILSILVAVYGIASHGRALDYDYNKQSIERTRIALDKPFLALRNCNAKSQVELFGPSMGFVAKRKIRRLIVLMRGRGEQVPTSYETTRDLANRLTFEYRRELVALGLL
jgi:hypothetical protein